MGIKEILVLLNTLYDYMVDGFMDFISIVSLVVSIVGVYYGIKAVKVTYDIYERQQKDSKDTYELENYRNNPYFIIEIGGLIEYTLDAIDKANGIDKYIKPVDKYYESMLEDFGFTLENVGFNWANVLGVNYKAKIIQDDIDKFNDRFRRTLGKDALIVKEDGTIIVTIGGSYDIFYRGIQCGTLGIYRNKDDGMGKIYNIRASKSFINLLVLKEKISKLAEYELRVKGKADIIPQLFKIELEVEYINSGIETESIKEDTYIGMRKGGGEVKVVNNTDFTYGYAYTFVREDKYNDLLEYNDKKLKREDECKTRREKGQKELEKYT